MPTYPTVTPLSYRTEYLTDPHDPEHEATAIQYHIYARVTHPPHEARDRERLWQFEDAIERAGLQALRRPDLADGTAVYDIALATIGRQTDDPFRAVRFEERSHVAFGFWLDTRPDAVPA